MDSFDQIASGLNRISELAQLRDKVVVALATDARRCGSCQHWMKSRSCPSERNVNGMSRGPSSEAPACGKFLITASTVVLRQQRIADAVAFANAHNLPVPEAFA